MITYKVEIHDNGTVIYFNQDDKLHRLDGPAYERKDGYKSWWLNGTLHRLDGPAIEYPDGTKEWRLNGKLHRLDGPAIECANGDKWWYQNNKRHRLDGPAFVCADGYKECWECWIEGKYYTEEQFHAKIQSMNRPCQGKKIVVDGVEYTLT